jgi:hypothetical protein
VLLELLDRLQREIEVMDQLECQKQVAVIGHDLAVLAEVSAQQEESAATLRELETERQELVAGFCEPGEPELTVQQLAARLPAPVGEAVQRAASEIVVGIQRLRQHAYSNAALLVWAAELARTTAQWMLGQGQPAPAYNRLGDREQDPRLSARAWNA